MYFAGLDAVILQEPIESVKPLAWQSGVQWPYEWQNARVGKYKEGSSGNKEQATLNKQETSCMVGMARGDSRSLLTIHTPHLKLQMMRCLVVRT